MTSQAGRRYVDFAIRDLARQFDELGARRSEMQVKLFGGADVLLVSDAGVVETDRRQTELRSRVGGAARPRAISVIASSLGGNFGLNIQFHTGNRRSAAPPAHVDAARLAA